jgi:hypothetical protein
MAADPTTAALVAAGGASLGGALVWRLSARHLRKRALVRRLASPMPERRVQAGAELIDLGLSRVAKPLLAYVSSEEDEYVRRDLALAIARRQWEPSGTARVGELRQWARAELEHQGFDVIAFGPAFTRLSDMGGPRLPERAADAGFDAAPVTRSDDSDPGEPVAPLYWTPTPVHEPAAAPDATAAQPS